MNDISNSDPQETGFLKKNEVYELAGIFKVLLIRDHDLSTDTLLDYKKDNGVSIDIHEVFECLAKENVFMSPNDPASECARQIAASALAALFFDETVPSIEVACVADNWQLWSEFRSQICEILQNHDSIQTFKDRFLELIHSFQKDPKKYCYITLSREEFEELEKAWNKQTNIAEVWKESWGWDINYMPLPGASCLQCLFQDGITDLNHILDEIVLPWCLKDTLWVVGPEAKILAMLKCAPSVLENNSDGSQFWNKSILAPMLLQNALDYSIKTLEDAQHSRDGSNTAQQKPNLETLWLDIIDIVSNRPDGAFLGRAFLKSNMAHLFFKQKIVNNNFVNNDFMVRFCIAQQSQQLISINPSNSPKNLFEDVFDYNLETAKDVCKHFVQTGLLAEKNEKMRLASLLAFIAPLNANLPVEIALDFLNLLLPYRNAGFHTSEHFSSPDIRHTLVGWLYAQCPAPLGEWLNTWSILASSRYKLRNSLFGDNALNIRYVLNFIILAGICAAFQLKLNDQEEASNSLLTAVKKKIFSCSHWDWFPDKFFAKLDHILTLPPEEFICPFKTQA